MDVHAYFILDRWAKYQPQALKQQGEIVLLNRLYQQQISEFSVLKNIQYTKDEQHLSIHERLKLHEIPTHLELDFG